QRIETEHGRAVRHLLERLVELRAVGDVGTVDREFGHDADELEPDADGPTRERGRGEPAVRTFCLAKESREVADERKRERDRRDTGDRARRGEGLVAVAGGDEE